MLVEVRWKCIGELLPGQRFIAADYIISQLGPARLGLELSVLSTYPAVYESIGTNASSWLECQTKFQYVLVPWVSGQGCDKAEIYIEGYTIGAWLVTQEQQFLALRAHIQKAVKDLKVTTRFSRDKRIEAVLKNLENLL